jgi:hypothetical protein
MDKITYTNRIIHPFLLLFFGLWFPMPPLYGAEAPSIKGFLQTNYSVRITGAKLPGAKRHALMLGEERGRLEGSFYPSKSKVGFDVKGDVFHDWVADSWGVQLREGYMDYLMDKFDVRIGRQIVTWGAGDLLFINDVFPKDWQALYLGRPLEYLKKGVDAGKLSLYTNLASAEFIAIPHFTPDNLPSAGRFFFFDPYPNITNRETNEPKTTFENTEYALRIYRSLGGADLSAYAYKGFYRDPGMRADNLTSPTTISYFYPKLAVYGASLQKSALGGVISAEYGYYDSIDDRSGKNPGIENSQSKFLIGYQKAFQNDLTIGLQYYGELMSQYKEYKADLPQAFFRKKQLHQYITLRVTKLLKYQTVKLSLFTFYSPDEEDFFITPEASINVTDNMLLTLGVNIFTGVKGNTTFGQHHKDSNLYMLAKYSF